MRSLNEIFKIGESNNHDSQLDLINEAILNGNNDSARDLMLQLLYEEIQQIPSQFDDTTSFLRYCGISSRQAFKELKEDIRLGRLTVSNPFNFNDPMDPILKVWLELKRKEPCFEKNHKLYDVAYDALKNLRMCCMRLNQCCDNNSALMWSHYANRHTGIAIQYRIDQHMLDQYNTSDSVMLLRPVAYRKKKAVTSCVTIDNALYAKGACWDYESEYRLIYYSKNDNDFMRITKKCGTPERTDFISLEGFCIEAIYLGSCIDPTKEKAFIKIANDTRIPIYKMQYNKDEITELIAEPLSSHR